MSTPKDQSMDSIVKIENVLGIFLFEDGGRGSELLKGEPLTSLIIPDTGLTRPPGRLLVSVRN